MASIKKILVATDYSERARRAEARGGMLSMELKADMLDLLTVRESGKDEVRNMVALAEGGAADSGTNASVPAILGSSGRIPRSGPLLTRSLRNGSAAQEISARAVEIAADLTVVAARGGHFHAGGFPDSSSQSLLDLMSTPILLVNRAPRGPYASVLVGIDFSEQCFDAACAALAVAPRAHFIFLHALSEEDAGKRGEEGTGERGRAAAREAMNALISRLPRPRALVSRVVLRGPAISTLVGYADQLAVDLVVLGKRGHRVQDGAAGTVTSRIAGLAPFDLLVVPGHPEAASPSPQAA